MTSEHVTAMLTEAEQALASIALPPAADEAPRGAKPFRLPELDGVAATTPARALRVAGNETLDLRIELGRTHIGRDEAMNLKPGAVIPLDNTAGDPVNICAGRQLIGRGEMLVLDGKLGVRVVELM